MISAKEVEEILCSEDVEGLLSLGAPLDEYRHEAKLIASGIERTSSIKHPDESSIASLVQQVWIDSFGPFSDEDVLKRLPVFQEVARRLSALLEERQRSTSL